MFRTDACYWCARFEHEVGAIYPKTAEAARFPLRRVDLEARGAGGVDLTGPIRYTPTFVLSACGKEIGRITGYPGEHHFWGLLGQAMERSERYPEAC
jgi:hypothetical protein